ncbi:M20/M25/M40 family metallo-hydrolase [Leadbetterella byssophila]|uniref:M20/M25/M40 family metallo-hydrolase n=1 Tax=Leadbetterella byssophila TaxID=316068 RepID=UPI0039A048C9
MFRIILLFLLIPFFAKAQIIEEARLVKHVEFLASDKLEGRAPGTKGDKRASEYIVSQFKKIGLKPYPSYKDSFVIQRGKDIKTNNILGYLDNGKEHTVIIGAHYDHMGTKKGQVYNGADDNASGVAAMLELARYYSTNKAVENYNYLFVAFSGEEWGLLGSKHLADRLSPENINLMINLDMIGRYREDKGLTIGGVGTSTVLEKWGPELGMCMELNFQIDSSGVGPSDHTSFYHKGIPVLFLFTGAHEDYHKPSDDTDKLNFRGIKLISNYVIQLMSHLDELPKIDFKKTREPAPTGRTQFKVSLGVLPNYEYNGTGLKIELVSQGKPASQAGIKAGDVLLKLDDTELQDINTYVDVLGRLEKGQRVQVVLDRKGEKISKEITL